MTYLSLDGGASWQNGGVPAQPAAGPAGDDVTVAFDAHGRGYVCATRSGHGANVNPTNPYAARAVYVWRTDDGGRSFSAPVTLVAGQYCDHPWVATGQGQSPPSQNVYVAWGAGASHTALDFTRSNDGGQSFEPPRRILGEAKTPSLVSAGPQLATGPHGLVCAVCDWTTQQNASGDLIGQVVAVARPMQEIASPHRSIWDQSRRSSHCPATSGPTAAQPSPPPRWAMPSTSRSPAHPGASTRTSW